MLDSELDCRLQDRFLRQSKVAICLENKELFTFKLNGNAIKYDATDEKFSNYLGTG